MVSFRFFVALALAGMVVASPVELGEKGQVANGATVDCTDIDKAAFVKES
jgi:hypothetical protein